MGRHIRTQNRYIHGQLKLYVETPKSLLGMTADPFPDLAPIFLLFSFFYFMVIICFFSASEHWHVSPRECQWRMCVSRERELIIVGLLAKIFYV